MLHDIADARLAKAARAELSLEDIADVGDFSAETLRYLMQRIEGSFGFEQSVYREVELDVVWRLLECAIAERDRAGAESADLKAVRDAVVDAHDLLGDGAQPARAAERLRNVLG